MERIDGFDVRKVDILVPGAIPYGFSSTYSHEVELQEGALYAWTMSDTNGDGLALDSGGGTCLRAFILSSQSERSYMKSNLTRFYVSLLV